ncbi:phenylalanine--tRNA ligase subunit beta [Candidatus Woesearchaeota archaeon]|jgi:phenylalanyl-tRNA synthetase beta chain|nr:phenylalanine--tRNA ligase subunit beta [Candidatus Woesearchaeota archaeon]
MPSITLNKEVFEKLIGKELSEEELKDRISMLGTDLEKIEDGEIHVEVFPNRPDMLSEQGFGRALSAFIGVNVGLKQYQVLDSSERVIVSESVKNIRPYTTCAIVRGLNFDDAKIKEIVQIQEKLHVTFCRNRKKGAIGIYPMEKIKTPIRYMAAEPNTIKFLPLESQREMTGLQILSQHPAGREYGHLLEGKEKFPFFIDANDQVLSMPPIINSHLTGKVTENTTDVFIECSGFDFNILQICLNIIVTALSDMGGTIHNMNVEYPDETKKTPNLTPRKMKFDLDYTNKLLGLSLTLEECEKLLAKMGCGMEKSTDGRSYALIPAYRADMLHHMDLVEDIAIAFGYENFCEEIPQVGTIGEEEPIEIFKRKLSIMLIGQRLLETNTYHLSNKEEQNEKMLDQVNLVELKNPLTIEYSVLRRKMLPSLIRVLSENKHHEYPQNLFEMGVVFKHDDTQETLVREDEHLSVCLCGQDSDFTKIKQILSSLMEGLNLNYETTTNEHNSLIRGRSANISCEFKTNLTGTDDDTKSITLGYIGELNPEILEKWGIEMPVSCFELNLSKLFEEYHKIIQ